MEHPPYEPQGLQRVEKFKPLIEEALQPNKELWLLRIPTYEVDVTELSNTEWTLKVNASNGDMGHIVHDGIKCRLQRQDIAGSSKYVYLPAVDGLHVKQLVKEVSLIRSLEDEAALPAVAAAGNVDAVGNPEEGSAGAGGLSDQERSDLSKDSSKRSSKSSSKSSSKTSSKSSGKRQSGVSDVVNPKPSKKKHKKSRDT